MTFQKSNLRHFMFSLLNVDWFDGFLDKCHYDMTWIIDIDIISSFCWKLQLASLYSNLVYLILHVTATLACVWRWDLMWIWNKFICLTFFLTWNKYYHNKAWNRWDDQKGAFSFNNQLQHWVHKQLWKNQGNCFRGRRPVLHGWIKGFYRGAKLCLLFYDVDYQIT